MNETQYTIAEWADSVFPPTNGKEAGVRAQAVKLFHEAAELAMACGVCWDDLCTELSEVESTDLSCISRPRPEEVSNEIADIAIVLSVLASRAGHDIDAAVQAKMKKNRARKWNVSPDGAAQHVPEGAADAS